MSTASYKHTETNDLEFQKHGCKISIKIKAPKTTEAGPIEEMGAALFNKAADYLDRLEAKSKTDPNQKDMLED